MSTFGTMKTRIADEIVRDDLSAQIANAVLSAIAIWAPTRFHFNEKRYLINTVVDQEYYALSSLTNTDGSAIGTGETLIEVDSFTLTYNDQPYVLDDRTQQWIDREQAPAATYTGQPAFFGFFGDQIRLAPIPDAAYVGTISGLAQLSTLSAEADSNAWMTEGEGLIRAQAKIMLYRDIVRDMEGVSLAKDALAEAYGPLERKMAAKATTGLIAPWTL